MAHSFSDYLLDLLMRGMGRLSILWMLSPFLVFLLPVPRHGSIYLSPY